MASTQLKAPAKKPAQEPEHGSSDLQTTGKIRAGGRFKKGESGNPNGRRRGTANKVTRAFREAVQIAYDAIGGDKEFAAWARENPTEFYRIAARLIPQELRHAGGDGEQLTVNIVRYQVIEGEATPVLPKP